MMIATHTLWIQCMRIPFDYLLILSTCSLIFIWFCKQELLLAEINYVIYFSQSQLLLAKTNEHRITNRKALYGAEHWSRTRDTVIADLGPYSTFMPPHYWDIITIWMWQQFRERAYVRTILIWMWKICIHECSDAQKAKWKLNNLENIRVVSQKIMFVMTIMIIYWLWPPICYDCYDDGAKKIKGITKACYYL